MFHQTNTIHRTFQGDLLRSFNAAVNQLLQKSNLSCEHRRNHDDWLWWTCLRPNDSRNVDLRILWSVFDAVAALG